MRAQRAVSRELLAWLQADARADVWAGMRLETRPGIGGVAVHRFTEDVNSWLDQARARSPHPQWLEGELAPISERAQIALIDAIGEDHDALLEAGIDLSGIEDVDDGVEVGGYASDERTARALLRERYGPHVRLVYLGTTRPSDSGKFGPW